jgi:hypothetical protein
MGGGQGEGGCGRAHSDGCMGWGGKGRAGVIGLILMAAWSRGGVRVCVSACVRACMRPHVWCMHVVCACVCGGVMFVCSKCTPSPGPPPLAPAREKRVRSEASSPSLSARRVRGDLTCSSCSSICRAGSAAGQRVLATCGSAMQCIVKVVC